MNEKLSGLKRISPFLIALLCVAGACGASENTGPATSADVAQVPLEVLRAAPIEITVGAQRLTLSSLVYRNFQPSTSGTGTPLTAGLRVQRSDARTVDATVRADAAWVIDGEQVWSAAIAEEHPPTTQQPFYEVVLRGGPEWPVGHIVDVIVRLRTGAEAPQLVRAPNQVIVAVQ